ncbi:MAG: hypothetical protein WAT81_03820 [Candidatus Moraniibacteriota bacterium]
MSRYDQLVRHWEWADTLWAIVRDSTSDRDFAERLAIFSATVSAAAASDRQVNEVRDSGYGMNGAATPHLTASEGGISPSSPDPVPPEA